MIGEASVKQDRTELVAAAREGDRDAMELLIQNELPWVRGVVSGYIRSPEVVDDLCQDVFVSVWQSLGSLRRVAGFRSWLYRITTNKVRSYLRTRKRDRFAVLPDDVPDPGGDEAADALDRQDAVREALQRLAPEYRDPLIIHYLQGRSCAETAEILGLRPVTARIRLLRGRRQLQELLSKQGVV
jgi:RNA polymerase sigma-70 factor (ECF subfamily)